MRVRSLESQDLSVARCSDCVSISRFVVGPGTSNDHFLPPKYVTLSEPGVVIQGFIMNSGQRSTSGSSSLEPPKFERMLDFPIFGVFFPMRMESTSFRVCSRVRRSGIILDVES